ncbi:MAG: hypothetical protein QGM50_12160 [Anaerolineae bacterium]|nr:hypothetical protein [Anaerolineae bacterium]MDK1081736.1 hypothetical protein [Anaerolineae bacterium]MDK1119526.1 hypothetical protein [Anaerolineae bacterium]
MKRKFFIRWTGFIATLLLVSACIPDGVRLPQSPLLQRFTPKSGLIAYVGLDGNIYTINQGGGDKTAITDDATPMDPEGGNWRQYNFPTWDPESGQLAFTELSGISAGQTLGAIHISAPNGEDHVVAFDSNTHFPFYLYWKPNGEQLSFISASSGSNPLALQIVSADGEGTAQVIDTGSPYYWAWSPDSEYLFAHVGSTLENNPSQDHLSFLRTTNPVTETRINFVPSAFNSPDFSPDGELILLAAASGTTEGTGQLVLANKNGAQQTILTTFEGKIAFNWAPVGDFIAYIEGINNPGLTRGKLSFIDLSNPKDPITLETETEDVVAFFWSPDGEEVVYFVPHAGSAPAEGAEGAESDLPAQPPFLSIHIAEAKNGKIRDLGTFIPTEEFVSILPYFNQYQHSATIWSPDGENIVISGLGGQENVPIILLVPSSGNLTATFLVEGTSAYWSWK